MKPGWKTTEFWLTLLTALPGIAVTAGLLPSADQTMLDSAASKIAAGLLAAITVAKYVHSRALVKAAPPAPLILLAALAFAGPGAAAQPAPVPCCLPWRAGIEHRLQQLEQQRPQPPGANDQALRDLLGQLLAQNQQLLNLLQQRPNNPGFIVLSPQQGPLQQIPLGGPPRQDIPLGGPPKQDIPLGGPPRQDIPLGPPPRQQLPLGDAPKQQIPLGEPKAPEQKPTPGATISYQRYSLWRTS
jgi:hypothetical protein